MLGYTLAQFRAYLESAAAIDRRRRRDRLHDLALVRIGGKPLAKVLDLLKD